MEVTWNYASDLTNKKIPGRKRHLAVDALGLILADTPKLT